MSSWTVQDIPDQSGKVVIITGANSGLGYESTLALARKGARVVMACRSMERAEKARQQILDAVPGASLDVFELDLASQDDIRRFASDFNEQYDRLDVLMNNAGIMIPPYGKTEDGFEQQFGVNYLGHFALTGLVLPPLLATPDSRVVTVSSMVYALNGRINFDDLQSEQNYVPFKAYGQSKLANILFMLELQRKLEAANEDTISVATHPGYARTNLQGSMGGLLGAVTNLFERLISQTAAAGARYQLYAATMPDVKGGEFFGPKYMSVGPVKRVDINARGRDPQTATRLWALSEEFTNVHYEALQEPMMV